MPERLMLTHVTLTTDRRSESFRSDVPYRDVELLKPMVLSRGGPFGGFDFVVTTHGHGAVGFMVGDPRAASPSVVCTVCWESGEAVRLWKILNGTMAERGLAKRFLRPPTPWLVVALMPESLAELTRRNLAGEGPRVEALMAAERAIAWAILDLELGASWC